MDKKSNTKEIHLVQLIVGTFLYYGRAVDPTILVALNNIGIQQPAPTKNTQKATTWLIDYMVTYPDACLRFFAGHMQLSVDSDGTYLVLSGAKSCFAGHFYLQSHPHPLNYKSAPNNAPNHTECKTLKNI
eukprot:9628379-Ditylum_brightwellii.AAC.1